MLMTRRLTETETRILALLADGLPHPRRELLACLPDPEYGSLHTVQTHVCNLRKKLPPGEAILLVNSNSPASYIHVNLRTSRP